MSSIGQVVFIALPILILLFIAVLVSKRKQESMLQRRKARAIRESAKQLEEALEFLLTVDDKVEIHNLILERIKQLNQGYLEILPPQENMGVRGVDLDELSQKIIAGEKKRAVLKSDREIRYAKKQFARILKSFSPMVKNKSAAEATVLEFRRYLRISILDLEVDAYTAQGDLAAQRGDVTSASGYYKNARKKLIDFNMQYPEKNQRIKELANKTANLFNGAPVEEGNLAKQLSKEVDSNKDEHGFSADPNQDIKQKF